jgi:twitching motility protein PilT
MVNLRDLLEDMTKRGASDLHLTVGSPPQLRVDGKLVPMQYDPLTPEETKKLSYSVMNEKQRKGFSPFKRTSRLPSRVSNKKFTGF